MSLLIPSAKGSPFTPGTAKTRRPSFRACFAVISAPLDLPASITSVQRDSAAMMRFRLGRVHRVADVVHGVLGDDRASE